MHSTLDPKQTDPRDVFARVDEEIARAYEQIALADKQLSNLAHDAPSHPPAAVNNVRGRRSGGRAVRGFAGILLAACIGVAAIAWQSPYGDAARQMIAGWAPQLVLTSSPPPDNPGLSAQPTPPAVEAAANAAPPQPAPPAPTAPEAVAPTAAALSPESAQLLQSMARDLASVGQEIEQIKASIEQLKASIEQLKTSQQQMSRDVAKASEQNLRPRISALPPQSAAARARKPMPQFPPRQAAAAPRLPRAAAPYVPRQAEPQPEATAEPQAEPELSSVPRSPMPLR